MCKKLSGGVKLSGFIDTKESSSAESLTPRSKNHGFKYFRKIEAIFENNSACKLGAQKVSLAKQLGDL